MRVCVCVSVCEGVCVCVCFVVLLGFFVVFYGVGWCHLDSCHCPVSRIPGVCINPGAVIDR